MWRSYCDAEPFSALTALLADDPTAEARTGAWQTFFWSITKSDDPALHNEALAALDRPDHTLACHHAILDWVIRHRDALTIDSAGFLALWDRLFVAVAATNRPIEDQTRRDVVLSMLNSAEGKLGSVLLEEFGRIRDSDQPDYVGIFDRVERLVGAPEQLGFLGTASMFDGLRALYHADAGRTAAILLPLARWTSPFASAAWSVLLRGNIPSPDLYELLKPDLLEAVTHAELDRSLDNVALWLLLPLFSNQDAGPRYALTSLEVRHALSRSLEVVRGRAAYWFSEAIEQIEGDPGRNWEVKLGPLFRDVWPLEPSCRTPHATTHLVRFALKIGDAFDDAIPAIVPCLGPLEPYEVEMWLDNEEEAGRYYREAPTAMLRLIEAVVNPEAIPSRLAGMLDKLVAADPTIRDDLAYRKLLGWARRRAAP